MANTVIDTRDMPEKEQGREKQEHSNANRPKIENRAFHYKDILHGFLNAQNQP